VKSRSFSRFDPAGDNGDRPGATFVPGERSVTLNKLSTDDVEFRISTGTVSDEMTTGGETPSMSGPNPSTFLAAPMIRSYQ